MSLIEKLKKAREVSVDIGDLKFTIRRPTDLEMYELKGNGSARRILPFVIGWDGVKESDIVNGGDPHPVKFDESLRDEWLSDRSDLLWPLVGKVLDKYHEDKLQKAEAEKN